MGIFQNGRLGRQLWMRTRTERLGKADEISVSYCFASDSVAAYTIVRSWRQDGVKQNSKCHRDWIHAKETFPDPGASSIHGSEKCVDTKTVLGWFGALVLKKSLANFGPHSAGPVCIAHLATPLTAIHPTYFQGGQDPQTSGSTPMIVYIAACKTISPTAGFAMWTYSGLKVQRKHDTARSEVLHFEALRSGTPLYSRWLTKR